MPRRACSCSKVRRLLHRRGIDVPYPTLHRFAVAELGFGQRGPTIPVADGKPGEEVHIDTGWMMLSEPVATGPGGCQDHRDHRDPGTHLVERRRFFALLVPS